MPAGTSVRQYADEALLTHGIRFAPQYAVEHLATIAAMVAADLGVSALPLLAAQVVQRPEVVDRKSTRLNSSHLVISYAVFCLKKKYRRLQCQRWPCSSTLVDPR